MKRLLRTWLVLAALGVPLLGQVKEPTLDDVLAGYYKARGGLEKLQALKGWKLTGTIVLTAQGLAMPLAMWQKSPDKLRVETTFEGRTTVQAYDGRTAWWIVPLVSAQAREMPPDQGLPFRRQAGFEDPLVVWKEKGHRLELLGRAQAEGVPVRRLKLTTADGNAVLFFIDDAGLLRKSAMPLAPGDDPPLLEVIYGDYRPVDGLLMPFAVENRDNGRTLMTIAAESIEIAPDLPDSLFAMPGGGAKGEGRKGGEPKPAATPRKAREKKPKK
jgi:hypothetical protein